MAQKHNDSSQMKAVLQHNGGGEKNHIKKHDRGAEDESEDEDLMTFEDSDNNGSSQDEDHVKADDHQKNHKEKPKSDREGRCPVGILVDLEGHQGVHNEKPKPEEDRRCTASSSEAGCPSFSTPCSPSGVRGHKAEGGAVMWTQGGEVPSSYYPLQELKKLSNCVIELGRLSWREHTVLVDVKMFNDTKQIIPHEGRHMWSSDFVKMPTSQVGSQNGPVQVPRWDVIRHQLTRLASKKTVSVKDVEKAILEYNPKYKGQWLFDALDNVVKQVPKTDNDFSFVFSKIAALALELPKQVMKAIPLLRQNHSASITLSQVQISCLLANAFFCTFPHRNTSRPNAEYRNYPSINFSSLFGTSTRRKSQKLRAIMHYFKEVTGNKPEGLVTFERRVLQEKPGWKGCKEKMKNLYVASEGSIEEEGAGMLQVDFASSWIGGGVLSSGLVQEEILFLMNPELIVSRLFTERLGDNECLIITGSQQFSCYSGYGDSFEWAGPYDDPLQRDEWRRLKRRILAIDALNFKHPREQFHMRKVIRELNKAYCGFQVTSSDQVPDIATGKWGCGAFKGDAQLKAVIQLMAAAMAGRGLAFFTFGDDWLRYELQQMHHLLVTENITVGKLFGLLEKFCDYLHRHGPPHDDLFQFITKTIRPSADGPMV